MEFIAKGRLENLAIRVSDHQIGRLDGCSSELYSLAMEILGGVRGSQRQYRAGGGQVACATLLVVRGFGPAGSCQPACLAAVSEP